MHQDMFSYNIYLIVVHYHTCAIVLLCRVATILPQLFDKLEIEPWDVTTTVPFWSSHLDTDTRLLFCEDTYVKIPIEDDPTVESLFSKEKSKPLIVGNNSKEPSNL